MILAPTLPLPSWVAATANMESSFYLPWSLGPPFYQPQRVPARLHLSSHPWLMPLGDQQQNRSSAGLGLLSPGPGLAFWPSGTCLDMYSPGIEEVGLLQCRVVET